MLTPQIGDLGDIFQGELADRGHWIVANLQTTISWPVVAQKQVYRGMVFWLLPITNQSAPAVAMKLAGESETEARTAIMRFISALSWVERSGVMVTYFTGGSLPNPMTRDKPSGMTITRELELPYLPEPTDKRAMVALAFLREARGLNHPAYSFLSCYRVIEAAMQPKLRGSWIAANLGKLDHWGQKALADLSARGITDVGTHIQKERRQAIAHAFEEPVVDPDDTSVTRDLQAELPLMISLAELCIEQELGVKSRHTVWQEHLYELEGFRRLLGAAVVERIVRCEVPTDGETVEFPQVDIELKGREPYEPLRRMTPVHLQQHDGNAVITFLSEDKLVEIAFTLKFTEERLQFDYGTGIRVEDEGSAQACLNAAEVTRFIRDYIGNGRLNLFDSDSRELIARVDAFMPVNYTANHEGFAQRIAELMAEAEKRTANPGGSATGPATG